ncbi:MAG: MCP four helix bundle domain-containing protein [Bacteroidia bacterium]|nr:MCP four helix bundle domain-containing protein [Bacteroidia bacterium]
MLKSLRAKIFSSFVLLVLMLVIAGIMSIIEFNKVGVSIKNVMDNNYKSIEQTKYMLDALEREDSGLLMYLMGNREQGSQTIDYAYSAIQNAIKIARNNITEKDEGKYIDNVTKEYEKFHFSVKQTTDTSEKFTLEEKNEIYLQNQQLFFATKKTINELMQLNQDGIYKQTDTMKENAKRAMMPGIVSIVAAIVFALLLNFFISEYFINPINRLIDGVKSYYPEKGRIDAKINLQDEIKTLESEINNLIIRSKVK